MDRALRQGMSGQDVLDWQALLNRALCHCFADGTFGAGTRAATLLFQQRCGLPMHGIVDRETFAAMEAASCALVTRNEMA